MIEQQQQQIALLLKIAQSNDVIADKIISRLLTNTLFDKKVNASIEKRKGKNQQSKV